MAGVGGGALAEQGEAGSGDGQCHFWAIVRPVRGLGGSGKPGI
jgi:hypothetical protein